eukprot:767968-Hanusia_phi.AAC.5
MPQRKVPPPPPYRSPTYSRCHLLYGPSCFSPDDLQVVDHCNGRSDEMLPSLEKAGSEEREARRRMVGEEGGEGGGREEEDIRKRP